MCACAQTYPSIVSIAIHTLWELSHEKLNTINFFMMNNIITFSFCGRVCVFVHTYYTYECIEVRWRWRKARGRFVLYAQRMIFKPTEEFRPGRLFLMVPARWVGSWIGRGRTPGRGHPSGDSKRGALDGPAGTSPRASVSQTATRGLTPSSLTSREMYDRLSLITDVVTFDSQLSGDNLLSYWLVILGSRYGFALLLTTETCD